MQLTRALGRNIVWNAVADTPATAWINADLMFRTADERGILELFYMYTHGDQWKESTNWLSDRPLGEWHGIRTNDEGRVWSISLPDNNLRGQIPEMLFQVECLKHLDLAHNRLMGEIPCEIGQCKLLNSIKLRDNNLCGEIPEEIYTLANLIMLDLSNCQLTSKLSEKVGDLTKLKCLRLSGNTIEGELPASICRLTQLEWLHITGCGMSGKLPANMGDMRSLTRLHLSCNRFTVSLPASLKNIPNLKIACDGNRFDR
jgi:hypothetical protein